MTLCAFLVFATTICLASPSNIEVEISSSCGTVYDGITGGRFDMEFQTSTNTLGANWFGFGSDVLFYEWAIASAEAIPSRFINRESCFEDFRVVPNVQNWEQVKLSTSAFSSDLKLVPGSRYHVIVRATLNSGRKIVSISNGVLIITSQEQGAPEIGKRVTTKSIPEPKSLHEVSRRNHVVFSTGSCPIDAQNNCAAAAVSVQDKLSELYGPPVYSRPKPVGFVPVIAAGDLKEEDENSGDDDDNNQAPHWVLAPILVGGVLLFALLCLCVFLIGFFAARRPSGGGDEGPTNNDYGDIGLIGGDASGKDYAARAGVVAGAVDTETRVEFPDTQIRRLSITHDEAPDLDLGGGSRSPRRKHPIMSSTSSSFRDYRSVGGAS